MVDAFLVEGNFDFESLTGHTSQEDYLDCVLRYSMIASGLALHNLYLTPSTSRKTANKLLSTVLRLSAENQYEVLMQRLRDMTPERRGKALAFFASTIRNFEAHYE